MRLLGLVVEAERVHHQVDAEPERLLALVVAAGDHLVLPAAEAVARQRAAQIVLRVDDGQPAVALDPLEVRRRDDPPGRAVQHVERLPEHVLVGDADRQLAGQRLRQQPAHRFVEAAAGAPLGRIDEQEAAVGDVAAQARDVGLGRQREPAVARQHQERVAKQVGIGEAQLDRGRRPSGTLVRRTSSQASRLQRRRARVGQPGQRQAREPEQRAVADGPRARRGARASSAAAPAARRTGTRRRSELAAPADEPTPRSRVGGPFAARGGLHYTAGLDAAAPPSRSPWCAATRCRARGPPPARLARRGRRIAATRRRPRRPPAADAPPRPVDDASLPDPKKRFPRCSRRRWCTRISSASPSCRAPATASSPPTSEDISCGQQGNRVCTGRCRSSSTCSRRSDSRATGTCIVDLRFGVEADFNGSHQFAVAPGVPLLGGPRAADEVLRHASKVSTISTRSTIRASKTTTSACATRTASCSR